MRFGRADLRSVLSGRAIVRRPRQLPDVIGGLNPLDPQPRPEGLANRQVRDERRHRHAEPHALLVTEPLPVRVEPRKPFDGRHLPKRAQELGAVGVDGALTACELLGGLTLAPLPLIRPEPGLISRIDFSSTGGPPFSMTVGSTSRRSIIAWLPVETGEPSTMLPMTTRGHAATVSGGPAGRSGAPRWPRRTRRPPRRVSDQEIPPV